MSLLIALAAATLPTPAQATEIRCVALLAIVAGEQERASGWAEYPPLADDGARYAAVVGDATMKATGSTREQVRDMILAAVKGLQVAKELPRDEIDRCIGMMRTRAPAPPPPPLPRCAAILGAAYDAVKKRDGLTKDARDLATLATVLTHRARQEQRAGGKSEPEIDVVMGLEREAAIQAAGASEADLQACALLATPD